MGVCVLRTIKNIRFLITPLHHHFAIVIYNWGGGWGGGFNLKNIFTLKCVIKKIQNHFIEINVLV